MAEAAPTLPSRSPAVSLRFVQQNRWLRVLPRVLLALTVLPALLLAYALRQSQLDSRIGMDINHAGSLRYRSLWQFGASQEDAGIARVTRRDELETMRRIREDLRRDFPVFVAETDAPFIALTNEIALKGRVSWATAIRMQIAADTLTRRINNYQQSRSQRTALLYSVAIAGMALSIPLTLLLSRHLQKAERRLSEQNNALVEASSRFEALFAHIPVACYRFDTDGRIQEWNRACEETFGLPASAVTGRLVTEVIAPPHRREASADREASAELLRRTSVGGERVDDFEWEYQPPVAAAFREPKSLLSNIFPLRDPAGASSMGGLSATVDITARKRAEQAVQAAHEEARASEERVRIVADSAAVLLGMFDENGGLFFTNEYWREFTGRTLEQERGQGWLECVPPEDRERCDPIAAQAFATRGRFRVEHRLRRHDGVYRWLAIVVNPRYENGLFAGYVGSAVDITERKESETEREEMLFALLRSEARLAEAQRLAHLGSWELDVATGAMVWSDEVYHFYGFSSMGPIPTLDQFHALLGPEQTAAQKEYLERAIETGEPYERFQTIHRFDGTVRHGYVTAAVEICDETGKAKRIFGTLMDVTEQREAEIARESDRRERERAFAAREEAARALQASEARLSHIIERAHCLLWQASVREVDRDKSFGEPTVFNADRNTVLEWKLAIAGEAEGVSHPWLRDDKTGGAKRHTAEIWHSGRHESDRYEANELSLLALRQGRAFYEQQFRFVSPSDDAEMRWIEEKVQVERISPPGELGEWSLVGVCLDITERKKAEAQLEGALAELKRSNESLSEFASIASHDLKEPLRKIQMFGEMLERKAGPLLDNDARGYLSRMLGASERMQALIAGLLEYSRVTSSATRKRAVVNLSEIAQGVVGDLEARIADGGGTVDVGPLPTIYADALQMRQLFQNLIGNALKFHRDDVPPVVTVRARFLGDNENAANFRGPVCRITVQDNGIGFDAARHANKVFGMFERLQGQSAQYEGTGVGLAICRKIVLLHGGAIHVQSAPGEGATFTIDLPVAPPEAA